MHYVIIHLNKTLKQLFVKWTLTVYHCKKSYLYQHSKKNDLYQHSTMSHPTAAFASAMSNLLQDKDTADFTVVCGDKDWRLHSLILATRSPFFKAAIYNDTKERVEKRIVIHDMDSMVMQQVVNYMYGEVIVGGHYKTLTKILEASVRFQMGDLEKYIATVIKKSITVENVIELGLISEQYNVDQLLQDCVDFIVKHGVKVEEELTPKFAKTVLTSTQNALLKAKQDLKECKEKIESQNIITVMVVSSYEQDFKFRIKKTTRLGKLKKTYCDRFEVPSSSFRFQFNGRVIKDDDTAEELRMKSDDVIHVIYGNHVLL